MPESLPTDTPVTDTLAPDTPVTNTPVTNTPVTNTLAADTLAAETPAVDTPVTGPPLSDTPPSGPPAAGPTLTTPAHTDTPLTGTSPTDPALIDSPPSDTQPSDTRATGPALTDPAHTSSPPTDAPLTGPALTDPALTGPMAGSLAGTTDGTAPRPADGSAADGHGSGPALGGRAADRGVGRGRHEQLARAAAPDVAVAAHGGAPGFDPRRTLPLRVELRRQTRRRRTQITLALLVVLPLILLAAFKLGSPASNDNGRVTLLDLATLGGPNFTLFALFAATGFLFVVVVAMFAGDTVASEASWSSLRYLLIAPVGRSRLLRQKLIVTLGLSAISLVLLPTSALLAGWAAFGWTPIRSPTGTALTPGQTLPRLAIIVVYIAVTLLVVIALGSYAGVRTDAPLGAVGSTVLIIVVSNILDTVTALGGIRDVLPTHYSYSWLDALSPTIDWSGMLRGTLSSVAYSTVLFALTWRHFLRKDIVS